MRRRIPLSVGTGHSRPALGHLKGDGVLLRMLCRGRRAIQMRLVFFRRGANGDNAAAISLLKRPTCWQRPLNDRRSVLSFGRGNSAIALVSPGLGPYPFLSSRYPANSPSCDANAPIVFLVLKETLYLSALSTISSVRANISGYVAVYTHISSTHMAIERSPKIWW